MRRRLDPRNYRVTVLAFVIAFMLGAGSGVTFAAFTASVSHPGPTITTKRIFPGTRVTAPFVVSDTSSGAAVNATSPYAVTADGRTAISTNFAPAYAANRFVELQFNSPLPGNVPITGATFNTVASTPSGTMRAYIQTHVASTGALRANYGNPTTDLGGFAGTVTYALPLTDLTNTSAANDYALRIYANSTTSTSINLDLASITLTTADQTATLYPIAMIDSADSTPATLPWSFNRIDTPAPVPYLSTGWTTAYGATRRMDFTFPAYTPTGAVVTGGTITHTYRDFNGATASYYLEIRASGVLIATKGSAGTPFAGTGAAYTTDVIAVPEIDTEAEADAITIRMFAWATGAARDIQTDAFKLGIDYSIT